MNLEELRSYCLALPAATEDVKWEHDLCFSIGGKMFCVASMENAFSFSVKVTVEDFHALLELPSVVPAPYLARYFWVLIKEENTLSDSEKMELIEKSYGLIKAKLPKKLLKEAGL